MSKRHFWKKNPDNFLNLDLFSKNDAYSVPEKKIQKFMTIYPGKKSGFFPEMTLTHFPKSDFLNLSWIFSQE